MKRKLFGLISAATVLWFTTGLAAAQGQYVSGSVGTDVSWPNCSQKLYPKTAFGVVGVTDGKGFSQNPCFKTQSAQFSNLSLYVNTGYPGQSYGINYQNSPLTCSSTDLWCLAYNYGYNAGKYAVASAQSSGVSPARSWWLDVETMNSWTSDQVENQGSLQGEADALMAAGASTVGAYSTTAQWGAITGGWINGWPSWGATSWTTARQAATYCTGHQFTGGPSYMMQFTPRHSLDQDYAC